MIIGGSCACDYYSYLDAPKIIFPDICKSPRFFLERNGIYIANTAYCLGSDSLYLLGLLNSRLFWFAISNISIPFGIRAGEYRYRLIYQYMEKVPIRVIDPNDKGDKARHDKILILVEQMLVVAQQLAAAQSDKDKDFYTNRCDGLDRQIDALVTNYMASPRMKSKSWRMPPNDRDEYANQCSEFLRQAQPSITSVPSKVFRAALLTPDSQAWGASSGDKRLPEGLACFGTVPCGAGQN